MSTGLEGKVAVVTGGARGIGAAAVRLFVARGARVVVGDVNATGLKEIDAELGDNVRTVHADISTEVGVKSLIDEAVSAFGRLDVLHNNAAIAVAEDVDVLNTPDEAWQKTFDFALMAIVWSVRHGVPVMKQTGGGAIVNTSSGAAWNAQAVKAAYAACKAGIESLTKYLGGQYGHDGIRTNAVRPGFVLTEGIRELFPPEHLDTVAQQSSLGRICTPEDIAEAVVWLASPASGYVNGQVIAVDGGGQKPTTSW